MKMWQFLIFISIFTTIYAGFNFYIYLKGWHALSIHPEWRIYYTSFFILISSSYILGRIIERIYISPLSDVLVWTGSFWLGAMLYFFFAVLLIDIFMLISRFAPVIPQYIQSNYESVKFYTFITVIITVAITVIAGYINAVSPKITELELYIDKTVPGTREIKLAVATDIHLGTVIGRTRLSSLVKKINSLKPDYIILGGDILDEDLAPVIRQNLGDCLMNLKSSGGVIASTGNHEYIGGIDKAYNYLQSHRILLLKDLAVKINGINFVGRDDISGARFTGKNRKSLSELLSKTDKSFPVIVIDHQPAAIGESVSNGADLHISGHTHDGQMFPINFITKKIFGISKGYLNIGKTHVYVSTGFGTWGPPIRIGNRPEIVSITLKFKQ